jgi:ATP-dependent Clp protease protease subunit
MTAKQPTKPEVQTLLAQHTVPFSLEEGYLMPTVWVNSFDEDSARDFFDAFSSFLSDDRVSSIVVYIDSFGGQVDSLAAMSEVITSSRKPVITVAVGKAFSAGAVLLALGSPGNRWVAPNSRIMVHRLQVGAGVVDRDVDDVTQIAGEIIRMNDVWLHKLVDRSKMKWTEFNKRINDQGGQWYLDAKNAVTYGFADNIGLPMIKEVRQWVLDIK